MRVHPSPWPILQNSRSSSSVGVTSVSRARQVPVKPAPSGKRAGNAQPRETFSVGKKKGQAMIRFMLSLSIHRVKMNIRFIKKRMYQKLCRNGDQAHVLASMLDFSYDG